MSLFGDRYEAIPVGKEGEPVGSWVFTPAEGWQTFLGAGVEVPNAASAVLITVAGGVPDSQKFGFTKDPTVAFEVSAVSKGIGFSTFVEGRDNIDALRFGRGQTWRVQFFRRRF